MQPGSNPSTLTQSPAGRYGEALIFRPQRWRNAIPFAICLAMAAGWCWVLGWPVPGFPGWKRWLILLLMPPMVAGVGGYFGYQLFACPVVLAVDHIGVWQERAFGRARAIPFDRIGVVSVHKTGAKLGLVVLPQDVGAVPTGDWSGWWPALTARRTQLRAIGVVDPNATIPIDEVARAIVEKAGLRAVLLEYDHASWKTLEGTVIRSAR